MCSDKAELRLTKIKNKFVYCADKGLGECEAAGKGKASPGTCLLDHEAQGGPVGAGAHTMSLGGLAPAAARELAQLSVGACGGRLSELT